MGDKTKKSKKQVEEAESEEETYMIKPSKDKARVDTSEWPLLLKVPQKFQFSVLTTKFRIMTN